MKDLYQTGYPITYEELEALAFDVTTPQKEAEQYQKMLDFLQKFIPDPEYRKSSLNKHGNLRMLHDRKVIYSEVGPPIMLK